MGIFKTITVSHKRETNGNYSILLQKTRSSQQPCLIFEAGTVVSVRAEEVEQVRRNGRYTKVLDGYACLGMLQYAYEGSKEVLFLVVVTGCVSVGKILNSEIFCITDTVLFSMRNGPDDQQLIQGLRRLLNSGSFYFSHPTMANQQPYDLTLAAQRASMTSSTDNRFFWNRLLHRHFERFGIDTSLWLVKVVCGGINISTVYIGGLQAKACLISRLSCERAGTRFNVRGVNDLGHVANFVETEQVIFINYTILSYLTIRGSIPLFWEQPGVQVGSHRIKMSRGSEISQPAYDKHMFLLKERYEDVIIINLLSTRESELALSHLFNVHHKTSRIGSNFQFINFDYHAMCSRGHKENLDKLFIQELDRHCEQYAFFHSENGEVQQIQQGVLRVNCLDCLDRTNSMQTFIGIKMLSKIVRAIDRIDVDKVLPRLMDVFENLWIQNGDQISRIYAGTGALEGKNIIKDGTLSVARTIQNNLLDGSKQSAIDILILGRTLNRDYSYRAASLLPHYFLYASPSILVSMCDKYLDYCTPEKLKIVIGTWNVNGGKHFDNVMHNRARPLSDWLVDYRSNVEHMKGEANLLDHYDTNTPVDIYAIGFQEIVDLNAGNIVASSTQNQRDWLVEIQSTISKNHQYLLVTSVQLVGVCLFVFIRSNLAPFIKDVCNDQVKTGLGGATGNKGAVAIRLRYKATSLCFVCAHFAAGQNQVKERNDDYTEITRRIQFPMGRSINSHDYVFWCGDFNYRLDKISNEEVRGAAHIGDYSTLLQYDQLKLSQNAGLTFKGYIEGNINFAPTYKYDTNSTDYDSSEKCRVPAYTDRILFKKRHETRFEEDLNDPNQIKFYDRIELLSSDHRPVVAELEIEVLEIDRVRRNQVFDTVLEECGPPDSTVLVDVDGHLDITDEQVFTAILNFFADEAGEIVMVRYVESSLMIIFSDGKSAVKAMELNGCILGPHLPDSKLIVSLRTLNWHKVVRQELVNNMDNTTNLVTGHGPSVRLEDDDDEAAQELNMSIGPGVDTDGIFLSQDTYFNVDQPAKTPTDTRKMLFADLKDAEPIPNSPKPPPPRPPASPLIRPLRVTRPPPPQFAVIHNSMSNRQLPAPPVTERPHNQPISRPEAARSKVDQFDPIPSPSRTAFFSANEPLGEDVESLNQSFNLLEFSSSSIDHESSMLPPPTTAPPALPPLTPSKIHAPFPVLPSPRLTKPTRAAPPPPIPSRAREEPESSHERVQI